MSPRKTAPRPAAESAVASSIKDATALEAGRERLLKGARKCFAAKGYGGTSVHDIASAAGISVGSLYKYVRAKEDLLWLMAESSHASVAEAMDAAFAQIDHPVTGLRVIIDALVREADRDRDLINLVYAEFKYMPPTPRKLILDQEISIKRRLVEMIESANASGRYNCAYPHLAAVNIVMMGSTWVLKSHLLKMPIADYIDQQVGFALVMVGAQPEPVNADVAAGHADRR